MKDFKKIIYLFLSLIKKRKNTLYFLLFLIFIFFIAAQLNTKYLISIPKKGGEINEIIIGEKVRFINPVIALSPIDKDLINLIYSPLLKIGNDGKIIENIATYSLSSDKKTYTITLKDNIYFHDGVKLTADDIIFTIEKIQDPLIKSPYYGSWLGVEVEKVDQKTVKIILKYEYYQFINNLILYPLPKHLWKNVAPEEFPFSSLNERPIGSGPFQIENVVRNTSGEIEYYVLSSFEKNYPQQPYINQIIFHFFDDLAEYKDSLIFKNKKIDKAFFSTSEEILTEVKSSNEKIIQLQTPKVFGIFINSNSDIEALLNKKFRNLFASILDENNKEKIEKTEFSSLYGFEYSEYNELLFNKNNIKINLTFFNNKKFRKIAHSTKQKFEKYGITINLKEVNHHNLLKDIIRDRNFDMILFGYDPGIISDLFYFFHSSQKNDPGANIAGIQNKEIDRILLDLRKNITKEERTAQEKKIHQLIKETAFFIPLYSPKEFYKITKNLKSFHKRIINSRKNRFDNIEN